MRCGVGSAAIPKSVGVRRRDGRGHVVLAGLERSGCPAPASRRARRSPPATPCTEPTAVGVPRAAPRVRRPRRRVGRTRWRLAVEAARLCRSVIDLAVAGLGRLDVTKSASPREVCHRPRGRARSSPAGDRHTVSIWSSYDAGSTRARTGSSAATAAGRGRCRPCRRRSRPTSLSGAHSVSGRRRLGGLRGAGGAAARAAVPTSQGRGGQRAGQARCRRCTVVPSPGTVAPSPVRPTSARPNRLPASRDELGLSPRPELVSHHEHSSPVLRGGRAGARREPRPGAGDPGPEGPGAARDGRRAAGARRTRSWPPTPRTSRAPRRAGRPANIVDRLRLDPGAARGDGPGPARRGRAARPGRRGGPRRAPWPTGWSCGRCGCRSASSG